MKSLLCTAALLPLGALAWGGKAFEVDEVVVVTTTRTVTVCPITDYWTCAPDEPTATWEDWGTGSSPTGAVTTPTSKTASPATTSSGHGGHGGHGGGSSSGSSSSPVGPATTSSNGHGGHGGGHSSWISSSSSGSGSGSSSTPVSGSSTSSFSFSHPGQSTPSSSPVSPTTSPTTKSAPAGSSSSTTSSPAGHGPGTSSSPVAPGSSTTSSPAGPSSGTTSPAGPGSSTSPAGPGSSTSPAGPGSSTTSPAGPQSSTTSPAGHGSSTSPAGPGSSTSPAGPGSSTTSPTGPGSSTTSPASPGSSSSSSPAGPGSSTSPAGPGSSTTSSPAAHGSSTSSSPAGPGSSTTSSPAGHGSSTSSSPAGVSSTSTASVSTSSSPAGSSTTSKSSVSASTSSSPAGSSTTSKSSVSGSTSSSTTGTSSSASSSSVSVSTSSSPATSSSTTSKSSVSSTTSGSVTTSSVLTTTTSTRATTTTSTTSCVPSQTVSSLPESSCSDNTADDRSKWCGKSVSDDTHEHYETGRTVPFTLTITSGSADFDGTTRPTFLINGGTPGPAIEVNWGDWVEVTVTNLMTDNATTIHWHGIRQSGTNDQDGVPGVTECAIPPLGQRTYRWLASTYGTGWYHSHALSQYGGGIRGPVIIHGPATSNYDYDMGTVMVDEVFSKTIFQMAWDIARLRGPLPAAVNYMLNGKNKAVDGTKGKSAEWTVHPGKKHLFRIINSSAQASYVVHFDNHQMTVISADYTPIVPYTTDTLYINAGQRYNVIVEMNQTPGAYFLRAITQTGCGTTNLNNGLGSLANGIFTYKGSCGVPVTDTLTPTIQPTLQSDCKDEPISKLVPICSKNGGSQDKFTSSAKLLPGGNAGQVTYAGYGPITRWFFGPQAEVSSNSATTLGSAGVNVDFENPTLKNMALLPSVSFNSSIYSNAVVLDGPANDWVYFVIQNNFQTSHPMHLHGHDFSVLGQGKGVFSASQASSLNFANPIRRDTAMLFGIPGAGGVAQGGWTVIGFQTDNPGAWVMHCHIIWHADGGMALQYIEQPSAIPAMDYWQSSSFQNECSAYDAYVAAGGEGKLSYESGLKRDLARHQFGEKRFGRHGMH